MRFHPYLLIIIFSFCVSCTATTRSAVISRFPANLKIDEFIYFHNILLKCTFAEVAISVESSVDQNLIDQTQETMENLRRSDAADPFIRYEFPEGQFAYFQGRSLVDVVGDFDLSGDQTLSYNIGENIFSAKSCLRSLSERGNLEQRNNYLEIISNTDAVVIIGGDQRHTTIVYLPDIQRAYYFGP